MKATGIVRRIQARVIITQKPERPHKHWGFRWFASPDALVSKQGFWAVFIHSKSEVKFTSLLLLKMLIQNKHHFLLCISQFAPVLPTDVKQLISFWLLINLNRFYLLVQVFLTLSIFLQY